MIFVTPYFLTTTSPLIFMRHANRKGASLADTADPIDHHLLFLLGIQRIRSPTLNLEATERALCLPVAERRPRVPVTPSRLEDGFSVSDSDARAKWLDFDHTPLDFRARPFSRYGALFHRRNPSSEFQPLGTDLSKHWRGNSMIAEAAAGEPEATECLSQTWTRRCICSSSLRNG